MTRIVLATAYIDLPDNHQLYTLAFTDDCDDVCSLMHFSTEDKLMDYCYISNIDIITAECDYGCEAMDYETGAPVLYDNHVYYASLWPFTPTNV